MFSSAGKTGTTNRRLIFFDFRLEREATLSYSRISCTACSGRLGKNGFLGDVSFQLLEPE